ISLVLLFAYLAQIRVYPEKEFSALRGKTFTPVLMELTYKRQILLVLLDFLLISFSYYLSYRLRFPGPDFAAYFPVFLQSLPAVIACKYAAFFFMGVYRGIWGFLSVNDVWVYFKATLLGTLLSVVVVTYVYRFQDFSKGIFIIDWFLITGFLMVTRGSFRLFVDAMKKSALAGHRVILHGAGRGGEILLREILNNASLAIKPVGFVDDNPMKAGKRLQGFPILGTSKDLGRLADKMKLAGIIVTFTLPDEGRMEDLRRLCSDRGMFLKRFEVRMTDEDLP
ncbi:MAG: glycosyl transferase, partial [Pseudomonadota bacterium]